MTSAAAETGGLRIDSDAIRWSLPPPERAGRPLLVLLHGHGMDETMGSGVTHRLPPELVVASLRAPLRSGGGHSWFPLDASLTVAQVDASAAAVWAWLAEQDHPVRGVLGVSQGAATAFQLLRRHPDALDFVINLAGFVAPVPDAGDRSVRRRRPPVFWGRGDRDNRIPAPVVAFTSRWLREHATLTERVYPGLGHDVAPAEIDDVVTFLTQRLLDCRDVVSPSDRSR
ncbi:MAG: alpha/beta hydrolase [Propionibacteriaceae bacterium]